jgi:hypothetical protein
VPLIPVPTVICVLSDIFWLKALTWDIETAYLAPELLHTWTISEGGILFQHV